MFPVGSTKPAQPLSFFLNLVDNDKPFISQDLLAQSLATQNFGGGVGGFRPPKFDAFMTLAASLHHLPEAADTQVGEALLLLDGRRCDLHVELSFPRGSTAGFGYRMYPRRRLPASL